MTQQQQIGFIGGGNMAASLIGGLIADGYPATAIRVAEPDATRRAELQQRFGVAVGSDNRAVVQGAEVVVLAVKPQQIQPVCRALADTLQPQSTLLLSVAAGIRCADIDRWLGGGVALVRAMPNTPALLQSGATALYANAAVSAAQRELAEAILRAVGLTLWLSSEAEMDAVTAVSGSGPAYFFLLIEALQQAAVQAGLPPESSRLLALQTAFGAARMALESADDAATLRQRVTSPGGTTEQAIGVLEAGDLRGLLQQAVSAAQARSQALADQLGRDQ